MLMMSLLHGLWLSAIPKKELEFPIGNETSDSEAEDDSEIDPERDAMDDLAAKQRKRAGLPELQLDQLPSSIAQKLMNLI
jgi:hypothetical protein